MWAESWWFFTFVLLQASCERLAEQGYGYGMPDFEAFVQREVGARLRGDAYLDYAAAGLYTNTQIDAHARDLKENLYGNPHSLSSSAQRSSDSVESARTEVLRFLGAPEDYEVVFTRSCTDSLRLVADSFPWRNGSEYKYLLQNHNSVLGIRDVARDAGAAVSVATEEEVEDWLRPENIENATEAPLSLFAYPAEENFAGRIFPLSWSQTLARRGSSGLGRWRVLLDACKFAASHPLNLTEAQPDFVTLSFYKVFGYPTGIGALILRSQVAQELRKHYWGGGTVSVAGAGRTKNEELRVFKGRAAEKFEDGTVAFLGISALKHGFAALKVVGGMHQVERHTSALAGELHRRLLELRHGDGSPVIAMYSREPCIDETRPQGPVVNFNVLRADGTLVSHIDVMASAAEAGVHLRAGMHCNPGAAAAMLGLPPEAIAQLAQDSAMKGCGLGPAFVRCAASAVERSFDHSCGHLYTGHVSQPLFGEPMLEMPSGSVRVSLGYLSIYEDIQKLIRFLRRRYGE